MNEHFMKMSDVINSYATLNILLLFTLAFIEGKGSASIQMIVPLQLLPIDWKTSSLSE